MNHIIYLTYSILHAAYTSNTTPGYTMGNPKTRAVAQQCDPSYHRFRSLVHNFQNKIILPPTAGFVVGVGGACVDVLNPQL